MSYDPMRNILLSRHRASVYWQGTDGIAVPDLLAPSDATKWLAYTGWADPYIPIQGWQDNGRTMPEGICCRPDYAAAYPIFSDSKMMIFKCALKTPASFVAGQSVRDLLSLQPDAVSGSSDKAVAITARWTESDSRLKLIGQVYDGSWYEYDTLDLGPIPFGSAEQQIFLVVRSIPSVFVGVEVWLPGHPVRELAGVDTPGGAPIKLGEFGSCEALAGNRPDIGHPPVTGRQTPLSFAFAAVVPEGIPREEMMAMIQLDQRGFSGDIPGLVWPGNNSKAVLQAPITTDDTAPFLTVTVGEAKTFAIPGPNDTMAVTFVNPADPTDNEVAKLVGVDVLEGTLRVSRDSRYFATPLKNWPAGTLIKGLLVSQNGRPRFTEEQPVPSELGSLFERGEPTVSLRLPYPLLAGGKVEFEVPDNRLLVPDEISLLTQTPLSGGTLTVGVQGWPDRFLSAVIPALGGGIRHVVPLTKLISSGEKIIIALSAGSGQAAVVVKGTIF